MFDRDGKIHIDTPMSRLLRKPPLMVAGMTPSTVQSGFNIAVLNAGYHIELAGGGHYNPKALRSKVDEIVKGIKPGLALTLNTLVSYTLLIVFIRLAHLFVSYIVHQS
jgi:enoyl reductase-like protein